jgi:hypothetical protein
VILRSVLDDVSMHTCGSFQSETYLHQVILLQVYNYLEFGEFSVQNALCYVLLSEAYFQRKTPFVYQAHEQAQRARDIIDRLPSKDDLETNRVGFNTYLMLLKCALKAKKYLQQRDNRAKNKYLQKIDLTQMSNDLEQLKFYLDKLRDLRKDDDVQRFEHEYLAVQFEVIVHDPKGFDPSIYSLVEQFTSSKTSKEKIEIFHRAGSYVLQFEQKRRSALHYFDQALQLAEEQEKGDPSESNRHLLAQAVFQRAQAKVKADRWTGSFLTARQ